MVKFTGKALFCALVVMALGLGTLQAALSDFETGYYISTGGYSLPVAFYDPYKDSTPPAGEEYPLLVYLHGAGNSGTNISGPASHPNASVLVNAAKNAETRSYVIVPQTTVGWGATGSAILALREFMADKIAAHPIDTDRIYFTGFSMGGRGNFDYSGTYPTEVAAIVPMAGEASSDNSTKSQNRSTVATWAFSGNLDGTITPADTLQALNNQVVYGGRPCFTLYGSAGHNDVWDEVRNKDQNAMISWLFAQENGQAQDDSMFIAWPMNETEAVTLDGSGDSRSYPLDFFTGYYGRGDLDITNGATVSCRNGFIAAQGGSRGNVVIDGASSAWNCSDNMYVGTNNGVGSLHVVNGGSVSCDNATVNQFSYLSGNGTIVCTEIRSEGAINPGDVMTIAELGNPLVFGGKYIYPAASMVSGMDILEPVGAGALDTTGTLTVDGLCRLYSKGSLNIELGGTAAGEFDALSITGSIYLTGELNVSFIDGFVPSDGDEFVIVSGGSVSGSFSDVAGLTGPDGIVLEVEYDYTAETVTLIANQRLAGDMDGDGHVTMMDFLYFKTSYGRQSGATWADGDYDGDGDVDIIDFLKLKNNYGI